MSKISILLLVFSLNLQIYGSSLKQGNRRGLDPYSTIQIQKHDDERIQEINKNFQSRGQTQSPLLLAAIEREHLRDEEERLRNQNIVVKTQDRDRYGETIIVTPEKLKKWQASLSPEDNEMAKLIVQKCQVTNNEEPKALENPLLRSRALKRDHIINQFIADTVILNIINNDILNQLNQIHKSTLNSLIYVISQQIASGN